MACIHSGRMTNVERRPFQAGLAALRAVNGGLMAAHGLQKLKGWFGGDGLDATAAGFEHLGLRPGRRHAVLAGVTETASGALMLLGAFTPIASAATTGLMTVAIRTVHGPNGPWAAKGGYEYNLTLIAAAFALADAGPGALAVDGTILKRRTGLGWAVAQLAIGVGSALAVLAIAERTAGQPAGDTSPTGAETATDG